MSNLDFIKKFYNGKNAYSDPMSPSDLKVFYYESEIERKIKKMIDQKKVVILTGNPGDGKTYLMKSIQEQLDTQGVYTEPDLSSKNDHEYLEIAQHIVECYNIGKPALIAVNEYPFIRLMKNIKNTNERVYNLIIESRKSNIIYDDYSKVSNGIYVIDMNNRNLLSHENGVIKYFIQKMVELLKTDSNLSKHIKYNIKTLSDKHVLHRIVDIFSMLSLNGIHYSVRDILGALSFTITICANEEFSGMVYYDALFSGSSSLMQDIKLIDPATYSMPKTDEEIWNGKIVSGWRFDKPERYPYEEEDPLKALDLFKSLKRKFYFEHATILEIDKLKPEEFLNIKDFFEAFDGKKETVKKDLIFAINKLSLQTDNERSRLRIWSSLNYDMSREITAIVSTKYIDSRDIEIYLPQPNSWLAAMEFVPSHILMSHKKKKNMNLIIDIDFLVMLLRIKKGYPIALISQKYEQQIKSFVQDLDDAGLSELYDENMIILADKRKSYKKDIRIIGKKYKLGGY